MNAHVKTSAGQLEHTSTNQSIDTIVRAAPEIPADIRVSQPAIIGSVLLFDIVTLFVCGIASQHLLAPEAGLSGLTLLAVVVLSVLAMVLTIQRIYGYTIASLSQKRQQMARIGASVGGILACGVTAALFAGVDLVALRPWLAGWVFMSLGALFASRFLIARKIADLTLAGRLARRAVIVGGGRVVEDLVSSLEKDDSRVIQILGLFDDRGGERSPDEVGAYSKLGKFDELVAFCRDNKVDLLIITLPASAEARILHLLKKLWVLPIDIRISAQGSRLKLRPRAYTYIGKVPFLAVFDKPLTDWGLAVKGVEDRILAALMLIGLAPVMALVALAVKLDSRGPVFFRQTRYGFNNEKIGVYKFRSMYVDQCDTGAMKLVTKGDPRVTKVGAFIRKTSLDELPQLINVLKGELSIVGPRPHAMQAKAGGHIYDDVVEGYFARHKVKPGITGWAQINGWRGETDTEEKIQRRVEYDLHYIDNWSVFFDLYIVAMTPVSLLNTKNAY